MWCGPFRQLPGFPGKGSKFPVFPRRAQPGNKLTSLQIAVFRMSTQYECTIFRSSVSSPMECLRADTTSRLVDLHKVLKGPASHYGQYLDANSGWSCTTTKAIEISSSRSGPAAATSRLFGGQCPLERVLELGTPSDKKLQNSWIRLDRSWMTRECIWMIRWFWVIFFSNAHSLGRYSSGLTMCTHFVAAALK